MQRYHLSWTDFHQSQANTQQIFFSLIYTMALHHSMKEITRNLKMKRKEKEVLTQVNSKMLKNEATEIVAIMLIHYDSRVWYSHLLSK